MTLPNFPNMGYTDDAVAAKLSIDVATDSVDTLRTIAMFTEQINGSMMGVARFTGEYISYLQKLPEFLREATDVAREQLGIYRDMASAMGQMRMGGGGPIMSGMGMGGGYMPGMQGYPYRDFAYGAGAYMGSSSYFGGMNQSNRYIPDPAPSSQMMSGGFPVPGGNLREYDYRHATADYQFQNGSRGGFGHHYAQTGAVAGAVYGMHPHNAPAGQALSPEQVTQERSAELQRQTVIAARTSGMSARQKRGFAGRGSSTGGDSGQDIVGDVNVYGSLNVGDGDAAADPNKRRPGRNSQEQEERDEKSGATGHKQGAGQRTGKQESGSWLDELREHVENTFGNANQLGAGTNAGLGTRLGLLANVARRFGAGGSNEAEDGEGGRQASGVLGSAGRILRSGVGQTGMALGLGVAGFEGVQDLGASYQNIRNQDVRGHTFSGGMAVQKDVMMMSLNPLLTTEQSREIIMGALNAGYTGSSYDSAVDFIKNNLVNMNMDVGKSVELLKTNIDEGKGSIDSLNQSLKSVAGFSASGESSGTQAQDIDRFTQYQSYLVSQGVTGDNAGIAANVVAHTFGQKQAVDENGNPKVDSNGNPVMVPDPLYQTSMSSILDNQMFASFARNNVGAKGRTTAEVVQSLSAMKAPDGQSALVNEEFKFLTYYAKLASQSSDPQIAFAAYMGNAGLKNDKGQPFTPGQLNDLYDKFLNNDNTPTDGTAPSPGGAAAAAAAAAIAKQNTLAVTGIGDLTKLQSFGDWQAANDKSYNPSSADAPQKLNNDRLAYDRYVQQSNPGFIYNGNNGALAPGAGGGNTIGDTAAQGLLKWYDPKTKKSGILNPSGPDYLGNLVALANGEYLIQVKDTQTGKFGDPKSIHDYLNPSVGPNTAPGAETSASANPDGLRSTGTAFTNPNPAAGNAPTDAVNQVSHVIDVAPWFKQFFTINGIGPGTTDVSQNGQQSRAGQNGSQSNSAPLGTTGFSGGGGSF